MRPISGLISICTSKPARSFTVSSPKTTPSASSLTEAFNQTNLFYHRTTLTLGALKMGLHCKAQSAFCIIAIAAACPSPTTIWPFAVSCDRDGTIHVGRRIIYCHYHSPELISQCRVHRIGNHPASNEGFAKSGIFI